MTNSLILKLRSLYVVVVAVVVAIVVVGCWRRPCCWLLTLFLPLLVPWFVPLLLLALSLPLLVVGVVLVVGIAVVVVGCWRGKRERDDELGDRTESTISDVLVDIPVRKMYRNLVLVISNESILTSYNHDTYIRVRVTIFVERTKKSSSMVINPGSPCTNCTW
jgi:hypothetical protein